MRLLWRRKGRDARRIVWGVVVLVISLYAQSWVAAASIAQGFQAGDSGIVSGALVSLKAETANSVSLTTIDNRSRLVGVVGGESLIELSNGSPVQVVTSGATAVLVSDINGGIKTGDRITASPLSGIGMKATESVMVVGTAQANLETANTETRTITAKNGDKRTVHIGAVPVLVSPSFYQANDGQHSFIPSELQDFASNLAGHTVSPVRVLIAGLLVAVLFVVIAMLLYSSVRASIISIGRNPLSEPAVHRSLVEVGVTVAGVLAFTIVIVYLVLTA